MSSEHHVRYEVQVRNAANWRFYSPSDAVPRPGLTAVRPVGDWRVGRDQATGLPTTRAHHYLSPDGNFTDFKVFVQQGGKGVAVDASGRVYLAAGHIQVYSPESPARPRVLSGREDYFAGFAPAVRSAIAYSPLLAVMKSVRWSRPPKATFAVHGSGTSICST